MLQDELYAVVTEAAMTIVKNNFRLWNAGTHALNYQVHPPVTTADVRQRIHIFCFKNAQMW